MNITIMTASTGGGHNRAAGALKAYINSHSPETRVDVIDAIEECSALLNNIVVKGYKALITYTPTFYGKLYNAADKTSPLADIVQLIYSQCGKRLLPIISEKKPDAVISCHPFTAGLFSYMKKKYDCDVPLISIVTDFYPHRAYIADGTDAYVTASKTGSRMLREIYGVPGDRIFFYGHPVYESFYEGSGRKREEVLAELGLDPEKLTVLMMAGTFGVADILSVYEDLVNIDLDFQMIVITGKNSRMHEAFEKLLSSEKEFETVDTPELFKNLPEDDILWSVYGSPELDSENKTSTFRRKTDKSKPTKLFYYVDNVDDYMHASDLIITKPGGLTTSESIACALPMAILRAYPGQEEQNAGLLEECGIGINLNKGAGVTEQIGGLLKDPERLGAMREACRRYVRKNSSEHIFELAKKLAGKQ